jgi:hypothetical protein
MGLHTGEPTRTDEGYVGIDVHRAARIAAAGHGGQIAERLDGLPRALELAAARIKVTSTGRRRSGRRAWSCAANSWRLRFAGRCLHRIKSCYGTFSLASALRSRSTGSVSYSHTNPTSVKHPKAGSSV